MKERCYLLEFIGLLAPIAFVFALSAISQIAALKKEVEKIRLELTQMKSERSIN